MVLPVRFIGLSSSESTERKKSASLLVCLCIWLAIFVLVIPPSSLSHQYFNCLCCRIVIWNMYLMVPHVCTKGYPVCSILCICCTFPLFWMHFWCSWSWLHTVLRWSDIFLSARLHHSYATGYVDHLKILWMSGLCSKTFVSTVCLIGCFILLGVVVGTWNESFQVDRNLCVFQAAS